MRVGDGVGYSAPDFMVDEDGGSRQEGWEGTGRSEVLGTGPDTDDLLNSNDALTQRRQTRRDGGGCGEESPLRIFYWKTESVETRQSRIVYTGRCVPSDI